MHILIFVRNASDVSLYIDNVFDISIIFFRKLWLYQTTSCKALLYFKNKTNETTNTHDNVIKWKHFPRYWPFVRGIHRSPVNSSHKGHWRGAFMFSLICAWINRWVNNREAGDLRRYRAHHDVIVMQRNAFINSFWASLHWESTTFLTFRQNFIATHMMR